MKSKLIKSGVCVLVVMIILLITVRILHNPYDSSFDTDPSYIYSEGNAPANVRSEIIQRLREFREGYETRDTSRSGEFADQLFSPDNILILGTMPKEIFIGHSEATNLVYYDWESWGDCKFLVDRAHVSSHGEVAWISTVGYVEFDLSRFLVMPLRLTGVLVKQDDIWNFQQLQFQFDLDLGVLLLLIMLLMVILVVCICWFLFHITSALFRMRRAD